MLDLLADVQFGGVEVGEFPGEPQEFSLAQAQDPEPGRRWAAAPPIQVPQALQRRTERGGVPGAMPGISLRKESAAASFSTKRFLITWNLPAGLVLWYRGHPDQRSAALILALFLLESISPKHLIHGLLRNT